MSKQLRSTEAEVLVVDPQPHMTYQPFLPEAAAGSISPRHSVVPLRRELRDCRILSGEVTRVDHARKVATVAPIVGPPVTVEYDQIVMVPGSVSRTLPIPGLAENAVGFKTIGEAIWLRNHVLGQLDVAATTVDTATRRRALTFVFIGGGYAGIEALAEMEDMARDALRYYEELDVSDMRWVLVEATQRILPEVDRDMGAYAVEQLTRRGMDIRLGTRLESCVDGHVVLSDGDAFDADTIVWTAGVKASPMLEFTDLPRDERGRLRRRTRPDREGARHVVLAERAARGPPGQDAGRQRTRADPRQHSEAVPAQARRLGGEPRPAQGRGPGLRREGAGLPGLVHAPHVPREPHSERQPEDPGAHRLDAGAVPQA
jgi:NADH dehydrogenase